MALAQNGLVLLLALALGVLLRWWAAGEGRPGDEARRLSPLEAALIATAVILNAAVTVAGWWLWQHDWLVLRPGADLWAVLDLVGFILIMDMAMYLGHAAAHHPRLYPLVHQLHHRWVDPRPSTLFVLHPLEVVGFGSTWLVVLCLYPLHAWALVGYAVINLVMGTLGHLGVEPWPPRLRRLEVFRWFPLSSFHGAHHANPAVNLGFYTTTWDRIFGTLDPTYDRERMGLTNRADRGASEVADPR
ncbi:sterol desaturase family protein [Streptomyces sp. CA-135486]|uniref:sterol desaturase family protein n=1 Tax=Streptomyces sp. CA-135486 TaxID=3240049 RepID=UPI003D8D1BC2